MIQIFISFKINETGKKNTLQLSCLLLLTEPQSMFGRCTLSLRVKPPFLDTVTACTLGDRGRMLSAAHDSDQAPSAFYICSPAAEHLYCSSAMGEVSDV